MRWRRRQPRLGSAALALAVAFAVSTLGRSPEALAAPAGEFEIAPGKKVEVVQRAGGTLRGTIVSIGSTSIQVELEGGAVVTVSYETIAELRDPDGASTDDPRHRIVKRDGTRFTGGLVEVTEHDLALELEDGSLVRVPWTELRSLGRGEPPSEELALVGKPVLAVDDARQQLAWGVLEAVEGGIARIRAPDGEIRSIGLGPKSQVRTPASLIVGAQGEALCRFAESSRAKHLTLMLSPDALVRGPNEALAYACAEAGHRVEPLAPDETTSSRVAEVAARVAQGELEAADVERALRVTLRRGATDQIAQLAERQLAESPTIKALLEEIGAGKPIPGDRIVAALDELDRGVGSGLEALGKGLDAGIGHSPLYEAGLVALESARARGPGQLAWVDSQDEILRTVRDVGWDPVGARARVEAEMKRMAQLRAAEILGGTELSVVEEIALVDRLRSGELDLEAATQKLGEMIDSRIGGDFKLSFADGGIRVEWSMTLESAEAKRQAWAKRGGNIMSFRAQAQGIFIKMGDITGGGGGAGGMVHFLRMRPPLPNERPNFVIGMAGVGVSANAMRMMGTTFSTFQIPLELGVGIGLGKFRDGGKWKGVGLSASYKPTIDIMVFDGNADANFNYLGFEIGADIVTLDSFVEKYAERAHIRVSGFFLPPVSDLPLVLMLGAGAVWY
jgi:hypothetical protein